MRGSESFGIEEREICGYIGKHFEGRDVRDEGSVSLLNTAITFLQCLRFSCLIRSRDNARVGCSESWYWSKNFVSLVSHPSKKAQILSENEQEISEKSKAKQKRTGKKQNKAKKSKQNEKEPKN